MTGWAYQVYGLTIHCTFPIPEWDSLALPAASPVDVAIRLGPVALTEAEQRTEHVIVARSAADVVFRYANIGLFRVHAGQNIDLFSYPGVELARLRPFLLGGMMALVLIQRGWTVLHASAVTIHGRAFAFVGQKGAGKSTMIAQLAQRGHSPVSDDITAIDSGQSPPTTIFGSPQIRLWPDTLDYLGMQPEILPLIHPQLPKRHWTAGNPGKSRTDRIPVAGVYELCVGPETAIKKLDPEAALLTLLRHMYLSRWPELLPLFPVQLRQLAVLIADVPVFQLTRSLDFDILPAVCQRIECCAG
jgi:hypothetical protein